MKNRIQMRMLVAGMAVLFCVLIPSGNAIPVTVLSFSDEYVLGTAVTTGGGDAASEAAMINQLLDMALGQTLYGSPVPDPGKPTDYVRSSNDFGSLPDADASTAVSVSYSDIGGGFVSFDLGQQSYGYLFAKYDGHNDQNLVWYIGDLTGKIDMPLNGPLNHGISHAYLFNPGSTVPDGGTTLALMGMALLGIGGVRRLVRR